MITVLNGLSGKYFSCTIPDVAFTINGYRAAVTMTVDGTKIYDELLYPIDSKITLRDLGELLTPYVKNSLVAHLQLTIVEEIEDSDVTYNATMEADVIFCVADFGADAEDFCSRHFLTTLQGVKETALNRLEYLHYLGNDAAVVTAYYDDASQADFNLVPVGGNGSYTTIDVTPSQFVLQEKVLVGFVVTAGNRTQEFSVDLDNPDCAPILIFDNSFGVEELLYCTGTHTVAPSYKRDTVWMNGIQRNYKIQETRTFKADTGVMNAAMANWADELFRSPYVRVVNFYNGFPNIGKEVLITDSKSEYNNEDDTLIRFTFSYQYSQRNQNVVDMQREGRIFDNTFDHTFQ